MYSSFLVQLSWIFELDLHCGQTAYIWGYPIHFSSNKDKKQIFFTFKSCIWWLSWFRWWYVASTAFCHIRRPLICWSESVSLHHLWAVYCTLKFFIEKKSHIVNIMSFWRIFFKLKISTWPQIHWIFEVKDSRRLERIPKFPTLLHVKLQ